MQTKSGKELIPIGIGGFGIGGHPNFAEKNDRRDLAALKYSISKGQNHIDTAEMYGEGHSEELIGEAMKDFIRKDLYIATKLWKTHVGKGQVRAAVEAMLKRLQTNYLDLLYIHAPWTDAPWQEAIDQINELIDEGLVRDFGVSNFDVEELEFTAKRTKHPIVANQVIYSCLHQDAVHTAMRKYCDDNNIVIVAYRPIERAEVLSNLVIQKIAKAHNASPAQIALAWLLAKKALPIPKASQKKHIDENLAAINIQLSAADVRQLDKAKLPFSPNIGTFVPT